MWLIPSHNRPVQMQRLLDSFVATKMSTKAIVLIDQDDRAYADLRYPENVRIAITNNPGRGATGALQWAFEKLPHFDWYGLLSDDSLPHTEHWDTELIKEAGDWNIALADDLYKFKQGRLVFGVVGGALARSVGFLMLPGIRHLYGDDVWEHLHSHLSLFRPRADIVIEHLHWSNGKANYDSTYKRDHVLDAAADKGVFEEWRRFHAPKVIEKVWREREDAK